MKIAYDIQTLQTFEKSRGIGLVTREFLKYLSLANQIDEYILVTQKNKPLPDLKFLKSSKYYIFEVQNSQSFEDLFQIADIYHITSPFMLDIISPNQNPKSTQISCLIPDIIPLAQKEQYINTWTKSDQQNYFDKLYYLEKYLDIGFCISDFTKQDVIKHTKISPSKLITTYLGVFDDFRNAKVIKPRLEMPKDFFFYLGGNNPRKNTSKLLEAYLRLSANIKTKYKLVIGGDYPQQIVEDLQKNIPPENINDVIFVGYTRVEELKYIYKKASLCLFPSTYEGFGLPIIESWYLNTPMLGSENSSIKEIIKDKKLMFDPEDAGSITKCIESNLETKPNWKIDKKIVFEKFSYEKSAKIQKEKWLELHQNKYKKALHDEPKKKLAWFAPEPETGNGIAIFSQEIINYLNSYFDITWFSKKNHTQFQRSNFDEVVFNIGNNEDNTISYNKSLEVSGIVYIHDLIIDDFINVLYKNNPAQKEKLIKECKKYANSDFEYLLANKAIKNAKNVIVHNLWAWQKIKSMFPEKNIILLSHPAKPPTAISKEKKNELKNQIFKDRNTFILGTFGFAFPHKRVPVILHSLAKLVSNYSNIRLLIVGKIGDEVIHKTIKDLNLEEFVHITGFVDNQRFNELMQITDLNINLRYPTMGETSGPLSSAIALGIPSIVTNINQFREYPDSFVWKVDKGIKESTLLTEYIEVIYNNKQIQDHMSKLAGEYAEHNLDPELFAYQLFKSIS